MHLLYSIRLLLALGGANTFADISVNEPRSELLPPSVNQEEVRSMASTATYEKVNEKKLFNGDTIYEYKLKNGFQVLLVPRHQAQVLTYQVWFKVGSIDEKLDPKLSKTGLAHLFEHMMFRGSEKYPDGKFDELIARMGGDRQNATTYYYRTNYYESVPSTHLEKLMELESDRMKNLKLTKETFEKEKGAVVGEFRRNLDMPARFAMDELFRLMYKKAPYQWTVIGTEEEIKGFTLEEAQYFYKTFYSPNNATLIVSGDVTDAKLMPLVVKYYGDMASQNIPRGAISEEPLSEQARTKEVTHKQATSEILLVGFPIPPVEHADSVPLSLLQTHLSRGMEARLRKLLVDKGIAVGASASSGANPNAFIFHAALSEKHKAEEALAIIDKELDGLAKKLITDKDFERALNQELLSLYDDISDNSSLGNWLGEFLMLCGNYMRGFEIIDAYKTIKAKDIQNAVKSYFKKERRSVLILRPDKKGKA